MNLRRGITFYGDPQAANSISITGNTIYDTWEYGIRGDTSSAGGLRITDNDFDPDPYRIERSVEVDGTRRGNGSTEPDAGVCISLKNARPYLEGNSFQHCRKPLDVSGFLGAGNVDRDTGLLIQAGSLGK
jgi:hypothetical protein